MISVLDNLLGDVGLRLSALQDVSVEVYIVEFHGHNSTAICESDRVGFSAIS